MKPIVYCVVGATASGKSCLALTRAQENNGIIINADSMQIYGSLRILTARPPEQDCVLVPHRLYGFLSDPNEAYSVARWREAALIEIDAAFQLGKISYVVGGTGLYIKALLEGLSPVPESDPSIRATLRTQGQTPQGLQDLYRRLQHSDPEGAFLLSPQDTQRIIRALEIVLSTRKPLSYWQSLPTSPFPYVHHIAYVNPPRAVLIQRAQHRLQTMFEGGAIEEVQFLLDQGLTPQSPLYKAVGVREISAYLQSHITREQAFEKALIATRQYIKRQQTWFNHQIFAHEILIEEPFLKL